MKNFPFVLAAAILAGGAARPALAQTATPTGEDRFYIELKDAPLYEALEMIFKATGNTSYIIDEQAKAINIGAITFNNVVWSSAVRQLANQNNFLLRRNPNGTYVVEPRPAPAGTGEGGAATPFGMPGAPRPGAPGTKRPPITTRANPQTRPPASAVSDAAAVDENADEKEFRILRVNHIYAGGIALLFGGQQIPTEAFLSPASGGGGGNGGNGGGGFGGQGGGGFGGGQFGGGNQNGNQNGGGFGGGGFGGGGGQGGGGFGGGGFGGGGQGGGGFGGGGFGGGGGQGGGGFGGFGGRF